MSPFNRMATQLKVESPSIGLVPHPGPRPNVFILLREWLSMLLRKINTIDPIFDVDHEGTSQVLKTGIIAYNIMNAYQFS